MNHYPLKDLLGFLLTKRESTKSSRWTPAPCPPTLINNPIRLKHMTHNKTHYVLMYEGHTHSEGERERVFFFPVSDISVIWELPATQIHSYINHIYVEVIYIYITAMLECWYLQKQKKQKKKRKRKKIERERESMVYQKRWEGSKSNSAKAASIGIGDEGTEERCKIGETRPNVDNVGSRNLVQVQHPRQVDHKVCQQPKWSQPLKSIIPCTTTPVQKTCSFFVTFL